MGRSGPEGKPFEIPKQLIGEAYKQVKANKGAAGVDGQSIEDFEDDLRNNLYKMWNRMSSGCYFPPPVRRVEIPKPGGGGAGSRRADGGGIVPQRPVIFWDRSLSPIRSIR